MKTVGIIPARYKSSRFPGKPLVHLLGKPMIVHVAEATSRALGIEHTYVATDSREIADVVSEHGFQTVLTSDNALTGTDRIWEAAQQIPADIYVNVQGDEPLINPADIVSIVKEKGVRKNCIINGMCRISPQEDPVSVNIPKVITTEENYLVYMSRLPIPGYKSGSHKPSCYMKQVCIYAFGYDDLEAFGTFGRKSYLEDKEDIEILRFLDLHRPVFMLETTGSSLAVDVPEDVPRVEAAMRRVKAERSQC